MNFNKNTLLFLAMIFLFADCTVDPNNPDGDDNIKEILSIGDNTVLSNHRDGIDYIVKSGIDVRKRLTIEPGVEIQFESGSYFRIVNPGSLIADGTASKNIIFTNTGSNSPSWAGLVFESNSGENILNHCIIEYAGDGQSFGTFNDELAAITLVGGRIRLTNSIIQKSGGNGLLTVSTINDCIISELEYNRFIENKKFPILIHPDYLPSINFASCTYVDNGQNMIGLKSKRNDRLNIESEWKDISIPYFLRDGIEIYKGLTIGAGVEVIFGNGAYIETSHSSNSSPYLTIQGTSSNHVVLRGKEALIGFWQGIKIQSVSPKNILEYTDISDGSSDIDYAANITLLYENSNLTINNCTSARSGSCDVVMEDFFGQPILTNNSPEILNICEQ